jgi:hypothetical protein
MNRIIISIIGIAMGAVASAHAAPMTVGGVNFDTDNAAQDVLWAQGGVFAGLPANRREACADPTDRNSMTGPTGVNCRADEAAGFDLDEAIELDENNTVTQDPDVLSVFFDNPLANGAGDDLIVFETLNQDDSPALTLILNGAQIAGTKLSVAEIDGKKFTIWGFDFSDMPFDLAMGAIVGEPIFLQTIRDDENTPIGSSDIAAIIGLNFGVIPEVPLPAAFPLFLAGLLGFRLVSRRKS